MPDPSAGPGTGPARKTPDRGGDRPSLAAPPGPWAGRWRSLRSRRWSRLATDLLLVLAVVAAAGAWQTRRHLPRGEAPDLALTALSGEPVRLSALRGKPVLLAFWAPWCTVCGAESDNLSRVQRWAGGRARVVSVAAAWGDLAEVRDYVARHGVDYPVLLGGDEAAAAFRVEAFPTVYFLDAEGRVKRSAAGYTTTAGLLWRLFL